MKKGMQVTPGQKKLLFELVEANDAMKDLRRNKNTQAQWASIVEKLNAIGPNKTCRQWRRTWWALYYSKKKKVDDEKQNVNTTDDPIISNDSFNGLSDTTSQNDFITQTFLDVSSSGHSDSQDSQELIEVYDECDDENDEVTRRIKEGEAFCSRVMRVVSHIMHNGRVVEDVAKMRVLTMNKLRFLLTVDDCTDKLGPEAQMSITDWLLFDTVLVHQHFDVIGMNETTTIDRPILIILFKLVVAYDIESLIGDQLAEAWAAVTLAYNNNSRQCTPMLLQRRWYQLKLATRERFYKLWSLSKGSAEMLDDTVEQYKPTPLQEAIVTRYKSLVVAPFIPWKELIKTERVILREQFESIAMNKKGKGREAPNVSLNPYIHVDSHLTNSNMLSIESEICPLQQQNQNTNTDIVEANTLENEPSGHKDTPLFVVKEIKSEKIPIHENNVINASSDNNELPMNETKDTGNSIQPLLPFNIHLNVATKPVLPTITNIFGNVNVPIETLPKIGVIAAHRQHKENTTVLNNLSHLMNNTATKTNFPVDDLNTGAIINYDRINKPHMNIDELNELPNNIENIDTTYSLDGAIKTENNTLTETKHDSDEDILMKDLLIPECIYGGEEFSNEVDVKDSFNNFSNDIEDMKDESHLLDGMDSIEPNIDTTEDFCINDVLSEENTLINNFTDIDLMNKDSLNTFSIHNEEIGNNTLLLDDGIEVPNDLLTHQTSKMDADTEHKDNENEDSPETNEKIIMNPLVITVKLDDMGLPIKFLEHVYSKDIIDIIHIKSKPVIKLIDPNLKCTKKRRKKVKLSSHLLKKPSIRKYNYKKLSINPDFNIILKKLNPSFLFLSRNQLLLKSCKPVTVDVSKEFENRLVNGIMYLDTNDNANIPNSTIIKNSQNISVTPPASTKQSLRNSKFDVKPVISVTTLKSIQDTPKCTTIPYKSDIHLVDRRLIKREKTSPLKTVVANTIIVKSENDSIPNIAGQTTKHHDGANNSTSKHIIANTNSKKNVEKVPSSDTKLGLHSLNTMLSVFKNYKTGSKSNCCWARERLFQLKLKNTIFTRHPCPKSSCRCCCKTMLENYQKSYALLERRKKYTKQINDYDAVDVDPSRESTPSKELHNELSSFVHDILISNTAQDSALTEILQHYEPPDKQIPLDDNNILLTTVQIPTNFKRFQAFRHYLKSTMSFPKGVNLLPSGQVIWNPVPSIDITPQYTSKLINLINEFNQLKDFANDTENTGLSNEVKSSLGKIFSKTLTKVTFVSELKYAYSNNGLFFRFDLNTGALDLTNITINVCKVPKQSEYILPD